ncbi:unnamed protein product [Ectocarpus sp. 12 AP-2014]
MCGHKDQGKKIKMVVTHRAYTSKGCLGRIKKKRSSKRGAHTDNDPLLLLMATDCVSAHPGPPIPQRAKAHKVRVLESAKPVRRTVVETDVVVTAVELHQYYWYKDVCAMTRVILGIYLLTASSSISIPPPLLPNTIHIHGTTTLLLPPQQKNNENCSD